MQKCVKCQIISTRTMFPMILHLKIINKIGKLSCQVQYKSMVSRVKKYLKNNV
jgi:hypothetical protein